MRTQTERRSCGILGLCCGGFMLMFVATCASAGDIYRCKANGQTTLTDRDTGNCESVAVSSVNVADAPQTSGTPEKSERRKLPAVKVSTRAETHRHHELPSIAEEQLAAKQRCNRIDDRLADIQSKMRTGYTFKQGEKLRERERVLQEQRRTERCR